MSQLIDYVLAKIRGESFCFHKWKEVKAFEQVKSIINQEGKEMRKDSMHIFRGMQCSLCAARFLIRCDDVRDSDINPYKMQSILDWVNHTPLPPAQILKLVKKDTDNE